MSDNTAILEPVKPMRLPSAAATEAAALISLIERAAADPSVDIDRIERMYVMYERAAARNAKAAYDDALSQMQPNLPVIGKHGKGHNNKAYALWEDIAEGILSVTAQHGFSLTFRVKPLAAAVEVTAVLGHRDGHREETSYPFPLDTSGSKNPIQSVGSSISYGKRYTASALLNIISRDGLERDDDGTAAGAPATISEDQATDLVDLMEAVGADRKKFCAHFKIEKIDDLPLSQIEQAKAALRRKAKGGK